MFLHKTTIFVAPILSKLANLVNTLHTAICAKVEKRANSGANFRYNIHKRAGDRLKMIVGSKKMRFFYNLQPKTYNLYNA